MRALVLAVDLKDPRRPLAPELAEFEALIEADAGIVCHRLVQRRDKYDPATMFGSGFVEDIAERLREDPESLGNPTAIFVFNDLRPRQRTNLEKRVPLPIIDRTMLILDIFAQRARSREGRLQVELAQLRYRQSNLIGAGADLSRLGGGIGSRGPGETKLEVDRRRISSRVSMLRKELESVRTQRTVRRGDADKDPLVALVGYTNVGKSSLLNRLSRSEGTAAAFVADQPFATLDPTMRRVYLAPDMNVRMVDTVGFITELPKELVAAFMATLEELKDARVLLHVIDASSPDWPRQKQSVETILEKIGVTGYTTIFVANKSDRIPGDGAAADAPGHVTEEIVPLDTDAPGASPDAALGTPGIAASENAVADSDIQAFAVPAGRDGSTDRVVFAAAKVPDGIPVSAVTGMGIAELRDAIIAAVRDTPPEHNAEATRRADAEREAGEGAAAALELDTANAYYDALYADSETDADFATGEDAPASAENDGAPTNRSSDRKVLFREDT